MTDQIFVGVDVAKDWLDIHHASAAVSTHSDFKRGLFSPERRLGVKNRTLGTLIGREGVAPSAGKKSAAENRATTARPDEMRRDTTRADDRLGHRERCQGEVRGKHIGLSRRR